MSTVILLLITGLGLGGLYFLVASGLSLIYGLMSVLNFAHGVFLALGAYAGYEISRMVGTSTWLGFFVGIIAGILAGALFAVLTELLLVRRLYGQHIAQLLMTVGLALAALALMTGIWGSDPIIFESPKWLKDVTVIGGARIPNDRLIAIIGALAVLVALVTFLKYTRYGLIIRAGVENRAMVQALGIDVRKAFTLVFGIGGAAAGLGGVLASHYFGHIAPPMGQSLLIFAFIVTIIGGLGSLAGAAIASVIVAVLQQFANYYAGGYGDIAVVLLLAIVLLVRPQGLMGRSAV